MHHAVSSKLLPLAGLLLVAACSSSSGTEEGPGGQASVAPGAGETPAVVRLSQISMEYASDFCGGTPSGVMCKLDGPAFDERQNPNCNYSSPGVVSDPFYKWLPVCTGGSVGYPNGMTLHRVVRINCSASDPKGGEAVVRTGAPGEPLFEIRAIYDFPQAGEVRALVRADTFQISDIITLDIDLETRDNPSAPWVRTGHGTTTSDGNPDLVEVVGTSNPLQEVRLIVRSAKPGQDLFPVAIRSVRFLSPICLPKPDGTCE